MITDVSAEFLEQMAGRSDFKLVASVLFTDGTTREFGPGEVSVTNNNVTDGAGAGSFPLGYAISRTVQIELLNDEDQLRGLSFQGARIAVSLTFELSETTEEVEFGEFTVLDPESYGATVIVTAQDDMWKTDKPYTTNLNYPATIGSMYQEICEACNIPYVSAAFTNHTYQVSHAPVSDYSYRQVLGFIGMIAGGNVRIDRFGYCEVKTYSFDLPDMYPVLTDWSTLTEDVEDIIITGVMYDKKATDENGNEYTTRIISGTDEYALKLENPLFEGSEETAIGLVAGVIVGKAIRKFEGDHIGYPLAEFMDVAVITDVNGDEHVTILTDINFDFCGFTVFKCSAEGKIRNSSQYEGATTIVEAKRVVAQERTAREAAIAAFQQMLSASSGFYSTDETQPDGSVVRYLHDAPTLSESTNVMKITSSGIFFSTNGGASFSNGVSVNGRILASILDVEGVNADWIRTGALQVRDENGNIVFSADCDTGAVYFNASKVEIATGRTFEEAMGDKLDTSVYDSEVGTHFNFSNGLRIYSLAEGQTIADRYLLLTPTDIEFWVAGAQRLTIEADGVKAPGKIRVGDMDNKGAFSVVGPMNGSLVEYTFRVVDGLLVMTRG